MHNYGTIMEKILRILMLEDCVTDGNLIEFELQEATIPFKSKRVITEEDFVQALQEFSPDLILSDYDLPQYNGALALAEAAVRCPDVPFILITGAVGEDLAIEMLTNGARDYIMKDRLHRLVPAVRRSLADAEERKAQKQRGLELEAKSRSLEEANTALKVLLKQRQEDKSLLEEQILTNIKKIIMPSIERMKHLRLNDEQIGQVKVIEKQLQDIVSPFTRNLSTTFRDLTSRQIQVASLIKEGMTTKEIAKALNMTEMAVGWHRRNLRIKLGIVNNAINIRSYLMSMNS